MSSMLQEIKTFIGITGTQYDFLIILVILIMILIFYSNILGMFKMVFDYLGGNRW